MVVAAAAAAAAAEAEAEAGAEAEAEAGQQRAPHDGNTRGKGARKKKLTKAQERAAERYPFSNSTTRSLLDLPPANERRAAEQGARQGRGGRRGGATPNGLRAAMLVQVGPYCATVTGYGAGTTVTNRNWRP